MLHAHLSPSVPATFRQNGSSVKTIRKHTLDQLRNETLAHVSSSAQKVRPTVMYGSRENWGNRQVVVREEFVTFWNLSNIL